MWSKRERWIGIAAIALLILVPVDKLVLERVAGRLGEVADRRQQLSDELDEAGRLLERRQSMEKRWQSLGAEALETESQAESRVLHAVGQWAQDSRLTLTSVKPQRLTTEGADLHEMTVSVAGTGTLQAAARFLWNVEHASIPVKIKEMQLGSANDTGNEMTLQLGLSTLYIGAPEGQVSNENNESM